MDFMYRFNIGKRVYAGFGFVLILLMYIAWVGVGALNATSARLEKYDLVSSNAVRVAKINGDVSEMRRNVLRYSTSGDEKSLNKIHAIQDELAVLLPEAIKVTLDPKRLENLKRMDVLFNEYSQAFARVPDLFAKKEKMVKEGMNVYGAEARTNFTEIMKTAEEDNDFEAAAIAGNAEESLMLVRIAALHFINEPSDEGRKQVEERVPVFVEKTGKLVERLHNPARKELAKKAENLAQKYKASFEEAATLPYTPTL